MWKKKSNETPEAAALLWALVVWRQQKKKNQVKSSSLFLSLEVDKTRLLRSSSDRRICDLSVAVRSRWTWKVPFTGRDSANSLSHSSGFISSGRAGVGARSPFWSRQKPSEHQTVDVCKRTGRLFNVWCVNKFRLIVTWQQGCFPGKMPNFFIHAYNVRLTVMNSRCPPEDGDCSGGHHQESIDPFGVCFRQIGHNLIKMWVKVFILGQQRASWWDGGCNRGHRRTPART